MFSFLYCDITKFYLPWATQRMPQVVGSPLRSTQQYLVHHLLWGSCCSVYCFLCNILRIIISVSFVLCNLFSIIWICALNGLMVYSIPGFSGFIYFVSYLFFCLINAFIFTKLKLNYRWRESTATIFPYT